MGNEVIAGKWSSTLNDFLEKKTPLCCAQRPPCRSGDSVVPKLEWSIYAQSPKVCLW